jgi:hypothetical protein
LCLGKKLVDLCVTIKETMFAQNLLNNQEQFIYNQQGEINFVVLPYQVYQQLLDLLEDKALAMAMLETQNEPFYDKQTALNLLEDND